MTPSPYQQTLQTSASVDGVGLHGGRPVRLTLLPAPVGHGRVFVRTDLSPAVEIPAHHAFVVDTTMNTTLAQGAAKVGTVEHLLAALAGLGIDNVRIELDGPEVPILDGSAAGWVRLVDAAGVKVQDAPRRVAVVRRPVVVRDGDKDARFVPADAFSIHCAIDFRHPLVSDQQLSVEVTPRSFVRDIARARTFGFRREVDYLRSRGLGLGGSLDNAIVVDDDAILNPGGLRFSDEFVRHKILDAVGDLSLAGCPIVGAFHASKTGHALNHKLVQALFAEEGAVEMVTLAVEPARRGAPVWSAFEPALDLAS